MIAMGALLLAGLTAGEHSNAAMKVGGMLAVGAVVAVIVVLALGATQ